MTADIYQERILDYYDAPFHEGECPDKTHEYEDENPICGDTVKFELKVEDGKLADAYFSGDGCIISQAAASMLLEKVIGKSLEEIEQISPKQVLEDFGPRLTPNRQKCCLLSLQVLMIGLHSPVESAA